MPLLVVVGEGPVDKREMASSFLATLGLDQGARIVQGRKSEAGWPTGANTIYASAGASRATIVDGACEPVVADFLARHQSPFACLLKAPHELVGADASLLGRTVAALYGSFNLVKLRDGISTDDPACSEAASYERQSRLMASFKAFLWVERSASVGRDSVIDPAGACAGVWEVLDRYPAVVQHALLWNATTLREQSSKLAGGLEAGVERALGAESGALRPEQYAAVAVEIERALAEAGGRLELAAGGGVDKADKKVKIMESIARCEGRQLCHADTLVAACLLDAKSELVPYARPVKLGFDAKFKPTFEEDASSRVWSLLAPEGAQREALHNLSIGVLLAAVRVVRV